MLRPAVIVCAAILACVVASTPVFAISVTTIDKPVEVDTIRLSEKLDALVVDKDHSIPLDRIIRIERSEPVAPAQTGVELYARNGDVLSCTLAGIEKNVYRIGSPLMGDKPVPLKQTATLGMIFHDHIGKRAEASDDKAKILREIRDTIRRAPAYDVVFVRAGQHQGVILSIDSKTIVCKRKGMDKKSEIPFDRVLAIYMRPFGRAPQAHLAAFLMASDTSGNRISGKPVAANDKMLQLESTVGLTYTLPMEKLTTLLVGNGRFAHVSDLKPATVEYHNYFEPVDKKPLILHKLEMDRNTLGGPLTLRGRTYKKGLGMHSYTAATFDIAGKNFTRFRSTIGIDDSAGKDTRRHVVFRVLVNGKALHTQTIERSELKTVDLPLPPDAKTITLVADFGEYLAILDRADWADAMLIQ